MSGRAIPPPGAAAFAYGRFSSDLQNPKSAEDQLAEADTICTRHGWTVVGRFTDNGETGRSVVNRPGLLAMLDRATAGEVDVIVVEDISRLGRNAADLHVIANRLKEAKVVIFTFSSGVMSGLDLSIRASMAEEYSVEHGHRVKRGHRASAKRGRVMGGVAYGYTLAEGDTGGAMVVPEEARSTRRPVAGRNSDGSSRQTRSVDPIQKTVVERIFRDYVAGVSTHQIAKALNGELVPGPKGGLWSSRRLTGDKHLQNGILRNPIYVGKVVYGKSKSDFKSSTGKTVVTKGSVLDQIEEHVEELRIVPDDLWDAAQIRLEQNSVSTPNKARYADYLLSGKVRCGSCGERYSIMGDGYGCTRRRRGGQCENRRRMQREDLEQAVLVGLKERLLHPHILNLYLDEYMEEWQRAASEAAAQIEVAQAGLSDARGRLDNLYYLAERASGTARDGFTDRINVLHAEVQRLERQVKIQRKTVDPTVDAQTMVLKIGALIDDMGAVVNGQGRDAARIKETLRGMITEVVVTPVPAVGKEDRGSGPVSIRVEGSLTAMVDHCEERVIHRRGTNTATLGHAIVQYKIYVGWAPSRGSDFEEDVALWSGMLDDADVPLTLAVLTDALEHLEHDASEEALRSRDRRARRLLDYFQSQSLVGCVHWSEGVGRTAGWVWSDRLGTPDLWRERAKDPPPPPVAIMRVGAPEAFGTVVSSNPVGD